MLQTPLHIRNDTPKRYCRALITGGNSGLGAAFARIMPPETRLTLTGRNTGRLEILAGQLARPGRSIDTVAADLATPEGRRLVIETAQSHSIDLLVCNAGFGVAGQFGATSPAAEQECIAVNIVATFEVLHALVPSMVARARQDNRRAGVIVVSSRAASGPTPNVASYGASKAFQLRLTESIAAELKDEPIDMLALCPTYTETDFFARAGLPTPPWWVAPESVAQEAMAALGHHIVHMCYGPSETLYHRALAKARRVAKRLIRPTP